MKYSSPRHAEKCCILLILSEQGRYFFHGGSLEVVASVECVDGAVVPVGGGGACPQKSHAIRLGAVSTKLENVAIPTLIIQISKYCQGNCMRNWVWAQQ